MLQAADILLYQATHVPVGEDQKQHIELTRDIALKFNTDFDVDLFVPPEPYIGGGTAARVMSLRDGRAKMCKSDPSDMSRINLTDSDESIAQKIRKAKTDPEPLPTDPAALDVAARSEEPGRHLCGADRRERRAGAAAVSPARASATFKPALADALVATIAPLRGRLEQLLGDPDELDRLLVAGAEQARGAWRPYPCRGLSRGRPARLSANFIDGSALLC